MWQELVPSTITMVDGAATPAPGTPACASMIAVETGMPARNSNSAAHFSLRIPDFRPGLLKVPGTFSSMTPASFGFTAAKNLLDGNPVARFQHALYPAWQVDRTRL